MTFFQLLLLSVSVVCFVSGASDHGFNSKMCLSLHVICFVNILFLHSDWKSFDEGKELAATTNKPIALLIHKSWCGACKALKPEFKNADLVEMSKKFVMINTEDDDEPKGDQYKPVPCSILILYSLSQFLRTVATFHDCCF